MANVVPMCKFAEAVFVYLYLGKLEVVVGEWVVDVISFQKIFGLCGLGCHIV